MSTMGADSRGFTIVELLVTLIVGGLLTASVAVFLGLHVHIAQKGRDVSVANSFVENKVEELRSAGFLALTDGTSDITNELPTELSDARAATLIISSVSTSLKKVDISVTYNDQGQSKSYSYTTYIGELGVGQY